MNIRKKQKNKKKRKQENKKTRKKDKKIRRYSVYAGLRLRK